MITLIGIGVVVLQLAILTAVFIALFYPTALRAIAPAMSVVLRVVLTGAVLGSLFFSEIKGFEPCLLCWWQRIFIFGAALLVWTGDIRKSRLLRTQVLVFALIGIGFALLHNAIDIFPTGLDVCGTGVSCLKRYTDVFGYITIPMMSLTVLGATLVGTLIAKRYPQE